MISDLIDPERQIEMSNFVIEALGERGVTNVSLRDLVESMQSVGILFHSGHLRSLIHALDEMDAG